MKSPYYFLVSPKGNKYNNVKKIGDFNFTTNTSIEDAKDVNRTGIVVETPSLYKGNIKKGDEVIVHHNIFREYYDIEGNIKYSKAHFEDNLFLVFPDSIYLYKDKEWVCNYNFIFIEPVEEYNKIKWKKEEKDLIGRVKYPNGEFKEGDYVSFLPESEYEIKVDGERLYRMKIEDICSIL